jgi:hypothetical protein
VAVGDGVGVTVGSVGGVSTVCRGAVVEVVCWRTASVVAGCGVSGAVCRDGDGAAAAAKVELGDACGWLV